MEAAQALLDAKADVEATDKYGQRALIAAAANGHAAIVKLLIRNGADVNGKDKKDRVALHFAAGRGHTEAARALLEQEADVNAKTEEGHTPLDIALRNDNQGVAALLRKHGGKRGSE